MPDLPPAPTATDVEPILSLSSVVAWARSAGPGRALAAAGACIAVVVVAAVAWLAFRTDAADGPPIEVTLPRADAPAAADAGGTGEGVAGGAGRAGGGASDPGANPAGVVVHVAGAVMSPGLYRLGGEPRVADALDAAGGPSADSDLDAVNLAGKLTDGERVYVPRRGEVPPAVVTGGDAGSGGGVTSGPVDLNAATAEQLEALPGVGPATVEAILSYRKEKGRFRSVEELLEVRGIGEAKLASLRSKVRV